MHTLRRGGKHKSRTRSYADYDKDSCQVKRLEFFSLAVTFTGCNGL